MSNHNLNCPKCNQIDRVEKVSAIFSGGITRGTYSGPSVALNTPIGKGQTSISSGYTTFSGGSQSLQSQKIAPPSQPEAKGMSGCAILISLPLIVLSLLMIRDGISESGDGIAQLIIFVPLLLLGVAILVDNFRNAKKRKMALNTSLLPQWRKAMTRWQNLYYCSRDDGVFDPDEGVFIPAEEMINYIYR